MSTIQTIAFRADLSRQVGIYFAVVIAAIIIASEAAYFAFDWPDFLRFESGRVLEIINDNPIGIYPSYYLWVLAWIAFVAVPPLAWSAACRSGSMLAMIAIPFGCFAGLCHAIGPGRWVFVVPALAAEFAEASQDPVARQALLISFETIHRFAGIMIGEHFPNILKGIWTLLVSFSLVQILPSYLRTVGIVAGISAIIASLEQLGGPFAGLMPFVGVFQLVWISWVGLLAFELVRWDRNQEAGVIQS